MAKNDADTSADMAKQRPSEARRDVVAKYISARLGREKSKAERGYQAQLARDTGFAPAHISNVIDGSRAPGEDFVRALADKWQLSLDELAERAKHWLAHGWAESDQPTRFTNRERAIECVGHEYSKEAVRRVRELRPRAGTDMPVRWWLRHMELLEDEIRWERESLPALERQDVEDTARVRALLKPPLADGRSTRGRSRSPDT